jgi:hypothetical protein
MTTQIFASGFEDDFASWTGFSGAQIGIDTVNQRSGAKCAVIGADGTLNECHKTFAPTGTVRADIYVRPGEISSLPPGDFYRIVSNNGLGNNFEFEIRNEGGVAEGRYTLANSISEWSKLTNYAVGEYNRLEMAASHELDVVWARWNGIPVGEQLTPIESIEWQSIQVGGLTVGVSWGATLMYFDDVVLDDAVIKLGQLATG